MLYDIQGVPIKVGSLVACLRDGNWVGGLTKRRVTAVHLNGVIAVEGGWTCWAHQSVVLEEPVWPNV